MEAVPVRFVPRGWGETQRRDAWWVTPLFVFIVLGGFVVYATWAAFQNAHYTFGPYLSPFYCAGVVGRFAARLVRRRSRPGGRRCCRSRRRC